MHDSVVVPLKKGDVVDVLQSATNATIIGSASSTNTTLSFTTMEVMYLQAYPTAS
jgi:hypothetical protein